jgi:glycine cleavage system H protein
MNELPNDLKYANSHEWIRNEGDGTATIGITDHAQELLGDLVYIELPEINTVVSAANECAVVESVKAASDIYSPVSGEVIAVNDDLSDSPETVNQSPFGEGWIFRVRMSDPTELDNLLDANGYQAMLDEDGD